MIMKGVMRPAVSAGSKRVGARLKCRAQLICPAGASVASARVDTTDIRARTPAATSRARRLVMIVSLRLGGHCFDRRDSGDGQTQAHGNAEGAADAAALCRLAKAGQLQVVEGTFQDQLRVDRDDAALGLRGPQSGLEPSDRPLSPFGEPPNVRELSGADGPEEHLRRRRALIPASRF